MTTNDTLATKVMGLTRVGEWWVDATKPIEHEAHYQRRVFRVDYPLPTAFAPDHDRNDLALVVSKLTREQAIAFDEKLLAVCESYRPANDLVWLLTCDPKIIADAIAEVVNA